MLNPSYFMFEAFWLYVGSNTLSKSSIPRDRQRSMRDILEAASREDVTLLVTKAIEALQSTH